MCVCDEQEGFHKAIAMVGSEFRDRLDYYKNAWLPARVVVETAVQMRTQVPINQSIAVCLSVLTRHVTSLTAELRSSTVPVGGAGKSTRLLTATSKKGELERKKESEIEKAREKDSYGGRRRWEWGWSTVTLH